MKEPEIRGSVFFAHLLGSVALKSLGLAAWYLSQYNMGIGELMIWRLVTYFAIGVAEALIIVALLKNRNFSAMLERMERKK